MLREIARPSLLARCHRQLGSQAFATVSTKSSGQDDKKPSQDPEERRRNLAKVLTQSENPAVVGTVSKVLKQLGSMFGGDGSKETAGRKDGKGNK